MQANQNNMMLLLLLGCVEKVYKLHPHAPQPLFLILPNKNFVNGHLLASSHLDQIWVASSQRLEVSRATEVLSSRVIWLSKPVVDLVGWVANFRLCLP